MKEDSAIYPKLGKNIRGLRKAWGETLVELADKVGAKGPSSISQYENGKRTPSAEFMQRISKHYRVSEHDLKYGDFEHMPNLTKIPLRDNSAEVIFRFFPIVCTPKAMEDKHFSEAYTIHKRQYEALCCGGDFNEVEIDRCMNLYQVSVNNGITEATANHLGWLMLFGFLTVLATPRFVDSVEIFADKKIEFKDIVENILPSFGEDDDANDFDTDPQRLAFLEECEVDLIVDIARLQKSGEYSDLGNYYFALRYLFNLLTTSSVDAETNAALGCELLHAYSLMQNKYCKAFLDKV